MPTSDIEWSYRAKEKSAERRPLNSHVIADQAAIKAGFDCDDSRHSIRPP
jgi:hypothetical protein